MENSLIYERIKMLCSKKGITIKKLEETLGFGKSTITRWANGHSPSADKLAKVSSFLGVSVDYLLGITDIEKSIPEILGNDDIISFQRAHERMSPAEREKMMKMLRIGFEYAFSDSDGDYKDEDGK